MDTPQWFTDFCLRVMDEGQLLQNDFCENPEFAHALRLADAMSTIFSLETCHGARQHFGCLVDSTAFARYLYALSIVKPDILDEIYEEFKVHLQGSVPEGIFYWKIVECREYPIPDELLPSEPTQEPA